MGFDKVSSNNTSSESIASDIEVLSFEDDEEIDLELIEEQASKTSASSFVQGSDCGLHITTAESNSPLKDSVYSFSGMSKGIIDFPYDSNRNSPASQEGQYELLSIQPSRNECCPCRSTFLSSQGEHQDQVAEIIERLDKVEKKSDEFLGKIEKIIDEMLGRQMVTIQRMVDQKVSSAINVKIDDLQIKTYIDQKIDWLSKQTKKPVENTADWTWEMLGSDKKTVRWKTFVCINELDALINWVRVLNENGHFWERSQNFVAFAFASYGGNDKDSKFVVNFLGMKGAGIGRRGAVHFFSPRDSSDSQFRNITGQLVSAGFVRGLDIVSVLCHQSAGSNEKNQINANLIDLIKKIDEFTGQKTTIKGPSKWFQENIEVKGENGDFFRGHPLWILDPNAKAESDLVIPSPWADWEMWAYNENGKVNGIDGTVWMGRLKKTKFFIQN